MFSANRKHGVCYGSLWKQHSTEGTPPSLSAFSEALLKEETKSSKDLEILTAALDKNERAKSQEFCVLVGNSLASYDSLQAFRKGDHPAVGLYQFNLKTSLSFCF